MEKGHISPWLVTVMNLNVMMGAGIFVNTSSLTMLAGSLGAFSYLAVSAIVLPLVLVIAELAKVNPAVEGGLVSYSKIGIGPKAGILSGTSYFLGKSISTSVLIKVFVIYIKNLIPIINYFSDISLFLATVVVICILNLVGMKLGSKIQLAFWVVKVLPVIAVIFFLTLVINPNNFSFSLAQLKQFPSSLPIALFAMMGFETCVSIGHTVKKGGDHLYRVVVTSFLIVTVLYTLFQFSLYGCLGESLAVLETPLNEFFIKVGHYVPIIGTIGISFFNILVMVSIVGACYGILQANNWNAYALAKELNIPFLTRINRFGMPTRCVLLQGLISAGLGLSGMNIISIQRIVVFGILIAYGLSVVSLIRMYKTKGNLVTLPKPVAWFSVFTCVYIAYNCFKDLF